MEFNDFYAKYAEDMAVVRSNQNAHDKRINTIEKEIDELKNESKAIYEINTNVRLLAEGMSTVKDDIAESKDERAKAAWYDKVVWLVVGGGISAVVAFLLK